MKAFLLTAFLILPFYTFAFPVTYNNPVWDDIDQESPPKKTETTPTTNEIAYEAGDSALSAYFFCDALGYAYISHLEGGTANPSVTWVDANNRWEVKAGKPDFLTITCDNGILATSSTSTIVNVSVNNDVIDYTMYYLFFLVAFSTILFGLVVLYTYKITKYFL